MKFRYLLILFLLYSCSDVSEINFENLSLDDDDLWLMDVQEMPDGTVFISGGKLWNAGAIYRLDGNNLTQVLDTSKTITHLEQRQEEILAVGFDAYFFRRKANNPQWNFKKLPNVDIAKILKDISISEDRIVVVGGHAYMTGVIYTLNQNLEVLHTEELENELSAVTHLRNDTWIAVGFGLVLKSSDNGESWVIQDIEGDFYKDIQFVSQDVGYILGQSGTILKTTNGGTSWDKIKSQSAFEQVSGFNKFEFIDENNAVIVANEGKLFHTTDGGQSWKAYKLNGAPDLMGLHYSDPNSVYVCGKNGFLARFSF